MQIYTKTPQISLGFPPFPALLALKSGALEAAVVERGVEEDLRHGRHVRHHPEQPLAEGRHVVPLARGVGALEPQARVRRHAKVRRVQHAL